MAQNDHIRLQDRDVPFERARLQIDELTLDPQNPRIQYLIGRRPDPISQDELDELLWAKDQVKALGQAIKQNGGVYDPIVVQKLDGRYVVREGNSRTVARQARRRAAPRTTTGTRRSRRWCSTRTLTEDDLAVLLADMHVTGKIRWDAYEQAKHVSTLYNVHGKTYDWLATHLRLSKSKITQQLKAYGWTTDYLSENGDPREHREVLVLPGARAKEGPRHSLRGRPRLPAAVQAVADGREAERFEAGSPARDDPRATIRRRRPSTRRVGRRRRPS